MEASTSGEKHLKVEDVQGAYVEQKDRLLHAIEASGTVLQDLRAFNQSSWVVRYPQFSNTTDEKPKDDETSKASRRKSVRRSLSFADDSTFQAEVLVNSPRKGLTRSVTLATIPDETAESEESTGEETDRLVTPSEANDFHVFRLDLKLGSHGSSSSPSSLVAQLEKASIANLLDDRISSAMAHLEKLRLRVLDTASKVLVTGDLNAGKSTFVNALLKRNVMPVDQQPCTTAFCEVHDARENDGKEELHIFKEGVAYDINDDSTFTRASISDLEQFVSENENEQQKLRVYLSDARNPSESLLNNGVVDISLIDAPGLNRDSVKTTAVFARQEEIDVVVFVVSAENHFTLSAKDFLWTASNEKAYLFIVVNKYDQIRDKAKCRRLILEQIKQLSPNTYEDAEDLVHFVDSATALQSSTSSFDTLESALRSFVLTKRNKSKLHPAATYLDHLLSDVDLLVGANAIVAQTELERARADLESSRPVLEKMKSGREALEESLEGVEENGASRSRMRTKELLMGALDLVGAGKLGVSKPDITLPSYPGLLGLWDYARDVRRALLISLDAAVKIAEDEARATTSDGVNKIVQLGEEHLPEGVERSRRVFMPEAMFSVRNMKSDRRRSRRLSGAVVAGATLGLGIGLAQRPEMLETTFFDIFDVHHQFLVHFTDGSKSIEDEEAGVTALGVASVGIGALTMVGGKAFGVRALFEGVVRVSDFIGNESARKWAAVILGTAILGTTAYYVLELPSTVPKTVGRRIRAQLLREVDGRPEQTFVELNADRISRETRKVLRLASWDLKERFRVAMDDSNRKVKSAEDVERKAQGALNFFEEVHAKTGEVRETAGLVVTA
ncbi:hypothetical protein PsYK624_138640 [Phanerochaete sordida]|uniref:Dynamin-type G domain-containing protein n=1 Tax=Phanerochaete sordida TaxID=48140 RepID=A0A9P3GMG0_9APHY|nr:hypothetical protein PsYK624_138640 [Phanerochaete sordida]